MCKAEVLKKETEDVISILRYMSFFFFSRGRRLRSGPLDFFSDVGSPDLVFFFSVLSFFFLVTAVRLEERRGGEEGRSWGLPHSLKKKNFLFRNILYLFDHLLFI